MDTCVVINLLVLQQDDAIKTCENNIKNADDDFKPLFIKQKNMFMSLKTILMTTVIFLTNEMNRDDYTNFTKKMNIEYNVILSEYLEVLYNLVQVNKINENQYIEYCNDTKKEKGLMDMVLHLCTMMKCV